MWSMATWIKLKLSVISYFITFKDSPDRSDLIKLPKVQLFIGITDADQHWLN